MQQGLSETLYSVLPLDVLHTGQDALFESVYRTTNSRAKSCMVQHGRDYVDYVAAERLRRLAA